MQPMRLLEWQGWKTAIEIADMLAGFSQLLENKDRTVTQFLLVVHVPWQYCQ